MCKHYFLSPLYLKMDAKIKVYTEDFQRLSRFSSRILKHWTPTIAVFSVATVAVGLYFTDWQVTNRKIPFYGRKFDDKGNL